MIAAAILKAKTKTRRGGAGNGGGGGGRLEEGNTTPLKTPAREARRFGDPVRESGRSVSAVSRIVDIHLYVEILEYFD